MTHLFLICAVVGGTVLLCQLVLTLVGLAGHAMDFDASGDFHGDVGTDFHADTAGFHGVDAAGHDGDATAIHHDAAGADTQQGHANGHVSSSWLFAMISFRTVVAALTFFGLAGLAAQSAGVSRPTVLLIALAAGMGAMYGVYWMMQTLARLRAEGTVRIDRAIGREATVYLTIPGQHSGAGKIHINLQNRTMEYRAITSGDPLPTGAKVVVVNVVASDTLEVQPAPEAERIEHA